DARCDFHRRLQRSRPGRFRQPSRRRRRTDPRGGGRTDRSVCPQTPYRLSEPRRGTRFTGRPAARDSGPRPGSEGALQRGPVRRPTPREPHTHGHRLTRRNPLHLHAHIAPGHMSPPKRWTGHWRCTDIWPRRVDTVTSGCRISSSPPPPNAPGQLCCTTTPTTIELRRSPAKPLNGSLRRGRCDPGLGRVGYAFERLTSVHSHTAS